MEAGVTRSSRGRSGIEFSQFTTFPVSESNGMVNGALAFFIG